MALRVISCFTYRTSVDSPWTDAHHSVNQFVDALKQRPLHGYGHVLVNATLPKRRLEQANASKVTEWFGEMASNILAEEADQPVILVPVPNSEAVLATATCRTAALAEATRTSSNMVRSVADILRWKEPMKSASSEAGPRDPSVLFQYLVLRGPLQSPARTHILIDDVLTTGGHLRACAAFLESNGACVPFAICGARADALPRPDPFERRRDELDDFVP